MGRKKRKDWPEIEQEWAAGQLSRCEIARRFKVDRKTMHVHMSEAGIEYGSLADDVRKRVQANLACGAGGNKATGKATGKATPTWDSEAVENSLDRAVKRATVIMESHRDDLKAQFAMKQKAEKLVGKIKLPAELNLDSVGLVKLYVDTVGSLVKTSAVLIDKERQAFNLDAEQRDTGNSVADAIREAECQRR